MTSTIPRIQRVISVLWPSFLMAGLATVALSTAFDPLEIGRCVGMDSITRLGAYTIGFFALWLLTLSSSLLTLFFEQPVPPPVDRPFQEE